MADTETLNCNVCGENWKRELKRGRKPTKCPGCRNSKAKPKPKSKPVREETLKEAERKYKQRVQMRGEHFKTIGEPTKVITTSGFVLETYEGFELADGEIRVGGTIKEKGISGRYRVLSLVLREDGSAYVNCIGSQGRYTGKYRSFGLEKISL